MTAFRNRRYVLPAVGLIALVMSPAALAGPAGSGQGSPDPQLTPAPGPERPVPERMAAGADRGIHISSLPNLRVPGPSRIGGSWTARIIARTAVRDRPGGKTVWVARGWAKWSGGTQQLLVLGSRVYREKQWLRVRLPERPNGDSGWLPRSRTVLGRSPNYLVLDLSRRVLTVFGHRGHRKARIRVVVGKRDTPTPLGLFAIYDRVRQSDRHGFLGPWVVPLTAHSDELRHFDGGPGLVALHGRDGASFLDPLGSARSHGCVRMNNRWIRRIVKLPTGTAIRIRR